MFIHQSLSLPFHAPLHGTCLFLFSLCGQRGSKLNPSLLTIITEIVMSLAPNWNEADDFVIVYNLAMG